MFEGLVVLYVDVAPDDFILASVMDVDEPKLGEDVLPWVRLPQFALFLHVAKIGLSLKILVDLLDLLCVKVLMRRLVMSVFLVPHASEKGQRVGEVVVMRWTETEKVRAEFLTWLTPVVLLDRAEFTYVI